MRHLDNLVELLRPLGVYDLREGRINRAELEVYGAGLDEGLNSLDSTAREMQLFNAEGFGLEQVEVLLPYRPVSPTVELRREALAALLRIGGDSFTLQAINNTLAGCGINAMVFETEQPGYVEVRFPDVEGIPEEFDRMKLIIEEILPCHLGIEYLFWYRTWGELGELLPTWNDAVSTNKSWYELAIWKE